MTTKNAKTFVVKCKKTSGQGANAKTFWAEVGRVILREGEKGTTGSLLLNHSSESFAIFELPAKPAEAEAAPA